MNKKRIILICVAFAIVIASTSVVSAGLFDIGGSNVKTHQFNYLDTFYFNVSDDLTNKTGVNGISIYDGVSYNYPNSDSVFRFMPIVQTNGSDELEHNRNDALYEEVKTQNTTQNFTAAIFELNGLKEYQVVIDIKNITIPDSYGLDTKYGFITVDVKTLDEAQAFVNSFKVNEKYVK